MTLLDKIFKKNEQEKLEEAKQEFESLASVLKKEPSVMDRYPDGLPLMVLEYLDYSRFGAMLKQEKLLPPSYDRRPADVGITFIGDVPRLKLMFKSKTSDSIILLSICKYNLSCAKKEDKAYYRNLKMEEQWREFAERTMYLWERGYRFELLDHNRKGEVVKTAMQEDMEYIESVRKAYETQL